MGRVAAGRWRRPQRRRSRRRPPSSGCSSTISPAAAPPSAPVTHSASPGPGARAADEVLGPRRVADRGDRNRELAGRRQVAAGHRNPRGARDCGNPLAEVEHALRVEPRGAAEPDVRLAGLGAHRREVAERRRHRLAADGVRRTPGRAEVDAVDDRIDRRCRGTARAPRRRRRPRARVRSRPLADEEAPAARRRSRILSIRSNSGEARMPGSWATGSLKRPATARAASRSERETVRSLEEGEENGDGDQRPVAGDRGQRATARSRTRESSRRWRSSSPKVAQPAARSQSPPRAVQTSSHDELDPEADGEDRADPVDVDAEPRAELRGDAPAADRVLVLAENAERASRRPPRRRRARRGRSRAGR